jgi:hypothetical protein
MMVSSKRIVQFGLEFFYLPGLSLPQFPIRFDSQNQLLIFQRVEAIKTSVQD